MSVRNDLASFPSYLSILSEAKKKLANAGSLDEVLDFKTQAEAAMVFARSARLSLEIQNQAAELKIRAERKAGDALKALKLRGGNRRGSNTQPDALRLKDLGVTKNDSTRWQQLARVPDKVLDRFTRLAARERFEVSTAAFLRFAKRPNQPPARRRQRCVDPSPPAAGGALEIVLEMHQHLQTIASLFEEILQRDGTRLQRIERQQIPRYLQELMTSMQRLQQEVLS